MVVHRALVCGVATLAGTRALAVVDGVIVPGEYQSPAAIQSCNTGFGNNFSELDTLYAQYTPGVSLLLAMGGNLEGNGNTIVMLFDTKPGGCVAGTLPGDYGVIGEVGGQFTDDWGTNTDGSGAHASPTPGGGSILPPGFNPDVAITVSHSEGTYYINRIDLAVTNDPANPTRDIYFGSNLIWELGGIDATMSDLSEPQIVPGTIRSAFAPWSNTEGVNGLGDPPGDPLSASFGLEIEFSADVLASTGGQIRLLAFITNGDGGYLSNQFLPPLGTDVPNVGNADIDRPLFDARNFPAQGVVLIGTPPCPADLDDGSGMGAPSGGVDINDLLFFLASFENGSGSADLDNGTGTGVHDGNIDINDLLFFLTHFEAGC